MSFGPGRLGVWKLSNGAGVLTDISAYCTKVDATFSVVLGDTTTFGATADTEIGIIKNGDKVMFAGLLDPIPHTMLGVLYNNFGGLTANNLLPLNFEFGPMGSTTGNPKFTANCFLSSYKVGVAVKGIPTFDGEVTITAGATSGVY